MNKNLHIKRVLHILLIKFYQLGVFQRRQEAIPNKQYFTLADLVWLTCFLNVGNKHHLCSNGKWYTKKHLSALITVELLKWLDGSCLQALWLNDVNFHCKFNFFAVKPKLQIISMVKACCKSLFMVQEQE